MINEIGWVECFLENIGDVITGKTPSTKDKANFGGSIPFVKPGDLDSGGYIEYTADTLTEKGFSQVPRLPKDAVMVTCIGNLGKIGITTKPSATNQQINSIVLNKNIRSKYLYHYLSTMRWWLEQEASATTVSIINKGKFSKAPIKLPPLAEQQQIVAKLDELLAQVDTLKTRLDTIPKILKRFRQSVLAAAVSGKLTEDCRGTKPLGSVVTIGEVANDIRYGTSKKCDYETGNIPVIRIPNIDNGFLNLTDLKFADFDEKELKNLSLVVGDLLLIRSNGSVDLVGKAALITEKDVHCLYAGYLIRIRLNQQMVIPKYLLYCLQSLQIRKVIEIQARSTSGVNNINSKELAALEFLLPHLEEQTEIVRRVEQLFIYADQIEQRVKDAQARVNHLSQAILAKAFRGELTAEWRKQNPDLISGKNSAAALLARIKAERQDLETNKVTNRRTLKKSGENMKPKAIVPIIEALKAAGQPLSSQDLLVQSGYPNNATTEQLEAFFLDIRGQLNAKAITRNRQGDKELFAIAE